MWFHPQTREHLADLLEIPASLVSEAMGDDVRMTWVSNNYAMEGIVHEKDGESHVDDWGIEWTREHGFNQITKYPLENASEEEILAYRFPEDRIEFLLDLMEPVAAHQTDCFIGCDTSPNVFEMWWRLRGMEQTFLEIALRPHLTQEMLKRCNDFGKKLADGACRRYQLDWLWMGDDVGSQTGMMMSPDTWRQMIKPQLASCVQIAKEHGCWSAFHSCGAIRPIIPDLVEIGVDVLNPIQCNCEGMDPLDLKREYGKELAFMGGVDTQGILPNGTASEVYKATERLIEGMTADGGGYVLAASHTVPPETPDENIFAMYYAAGLSREEIFDRAAAIRARA
jgi:uroporphyrinogen decarboxylase